MGIIDRDPGGKGGHIKIGRSSRASTPTSTSTKVLISQKELTQETSRKDAGSLHRKTRI